MKYWAYMNNKVCGPFEKEKLAELPSFSLSSMLCPDAPGGAQANDWKAASSYPEVLALLGAAPEPEQPRNPAVQSPIMMTMRGTLIEDPVAEEPAAKPQPATSAGRSEAVSAGIAEPIKELPAAAGPGKITSIAGNAASPEPANLMEKLGQLSAMLVSIGNTQSQLLDRLGRVESAVGEMKALLLPPLPKKD